MAGIDSTQAIGPWLLIMRQLDFAFIKAIPFAFIKAIPFAFIKAIPFAFIKGTDPFWGHDFLFMDRF